MATTKSDLERVIKDRLDRECEQRPTCYTPEWNRKLRIKQPVPESCWMCSKHDSLAHLIAEDITTQACKAKLPNPSEIELKKALNE